MTPPIDIIAYNVTRAINAGNHTIYDIANFLGVVHSSAKLRLLLFEMIRSHQIVVTSINDDGTKHFKLSS